MGIPVSGGLSSADCFPQHLSQVPDPASGRLLDLLPAAEAVDHHVVIGRRCPDGGQEDALPQLDRHVVVVAFEAKGAGHPAAPCIEHRGVESKAPQDSDLIVQTEDRAVVAMRVDQGASAEPQVRKRVLLLEELAQEERLLAELLRGGIVREEPQSLVTEHGHTTGLQAHDRRARLDIRA